MSAAARSLPPSPLPSVLAPLYRTPNPRLSRAPGPGVGGRQRLPYLLALAEGTGRAGGCPSCLALPGGGCWPPAPRCGAGAGPRMSHPGVPELCGLQAGSHSPSPPRRWPLVCAPPAAGAGAVEGRGAAPQPRWESGVASRYPGSRESWRSAEDCLHLQLRRGLLALRGARSSLPPARRPRALGARDHPEASGSPARDSAATQLDPGSPEAP